MSTSTLVARLRAADKELSVDECWAVHYSEPEGKLWGEAAAELERLTAPITDDDVAAFVRSLRAQGTPWGDGCAALLQRLHAEAKLWRIASDPTHLRSREQQRLIDWALTEHAARSGAGKEGA